MPHPNLRTGLKRRRRSCHPMSEFDQLPSALRQWLAQAVLPWSATSVRRQWNAALRQSSGNEAEAIKRLDQTQARLVALDADRVWGENYPA